MYVGVCLGREYVSIVDCMGARVRELWCERAGFGKCGVREGSVEWGAVVGRVQVE